VPAFVKTSCSFPITTTRARTAGDVPTQPPAESGASARAVARFAGHSEASSTTQTPTSR
jgi:hypothetical protein